MKMSKALEFSAAWGRTLYYRIAIRPYRIRRPRSSTEQIGELTMRLEFHIGTDREDVKACQPSTLNQGVRLHTKAGQHRASKVLDEWYEQIDMWRMKRATTHSHDPDDIPYKEEETC